MSGVNKKQILKQFSSISDSDVRETQTKKKKAAKCYNRSRSLSLERKVRSDEKLLKVLGPVSFNVKSGNPDKNTQTDDSKLRELLGEDVSFSVSGHDSHRKVSARNEARSQSQEDDFLTSLDDDSKSPSLLVSPRTNDSKNSSDPELQTYERRNIFTMPPPLILSTSRKHTDLYSVVSTSPSLLASPLSTSSTLYTASLVEGSDGNLDDSVETKSEAENNPVIKHVFSNEEESFEMQLEDSTLPCKVNNVSSEASSLVESVMKEAVSSVSSSSILQHSEQEDQPELTVPTPRKRLKAIFQLDPSNQQCADCGIKLNLSGTDEIYLAFKYGSKVRRNSMGSSSRSYPVPKGIPLSEMWDDPTHSLASLCDSSPNKSNCFRLQHAAFSPSFCSSFVPFSVFVCNLCAKAHRKVFIENGSYTKQNQNRQYGLKSIRDLHGEWNQQEVAFLNENKGNAYANQILERHIPRLFKNRISHERNLQENEKGQATTGNGEIPIQMAEREVFVRAKYELLAFILPTGPLTQRLPSWRKLDGGIFAGAKCDNPKRNKWLKSIGGPEKNESRNRVLHHELPTRLVDFFCVIGTNGKLDPSYSASLGNGEKRIEEGLKTWEDVCLDTELMDCYPPPKKEDGKDFYPDMSLPDHISKFVFPNGCQPAKNQPQPTFFTFVLTLESGLRLYGANLRIYDQLFDPTTFDDFNNIDHPITANSDDPLHLPKALVVLSHYPFFDTFRSFLQQLYRIYRSPSSPLPLERYIANFTREIPLPPCGKVEIHFGFSDELPPVKIMRPPKNELPLVNISYRPLFSLLSISNILVVFGCLLEEARVVICSSHYSLLTPICESLLSLLYPFVWQGCYIPVIPDNMTDVLEAPFPFLIGMHSRFLRSGEERPHGVVFVDVDNDVVHLGYDELDPGSNDQQQYGRRTPALPEKTALKLKHSLEQCAGEQYIMPRSNIKGQITYGENVLMMNSDKEPYALSMSHHDEKSSVAGFAHKSLHKKNSNEEEINRTDVLKEIDLAFEFGEDSIPFTEFITESGNLTSRQEMPSKMEKKRSLLALRSTKKVTQIDSNEEISPHVNMLDISREETSSFSAKEIRRSFLRFFVKIFVNYEKFVVDETSNARKPSSKSNIVHEESENDRFQSTSFLNQLHASGNVRNFLSKLLSSQMFERFLEDRIINSEHPEVVFFNESILAKLNRSKSMHLKSKKKPTPFLDDKSEAITSIFHPPPPSNWGLSDDQTYLYRQFPKLDSKLFGKIRHPKQWKEKRKGRRQTIIPMSVIRHQKALSLLIEPHEALGSIKSKNSFEDAPKWVVKVPILELRDTEWAIHALAYKYTEENKSEKVLSKKLLGSAQGIILSARQKQTIMLHFVVKVQALFRMHVVRKKYLNALLSTTIIQRQWRRALVIRKYGHVLNFHFVCVTQMQRLCRGFIARRLLQSSLTKVILLQKVARGWLEREFQKRLRTSTVKAQSIMRGRRARLGRKLVLGLIIKVQANIRGFLERTAIERFKEVRIQEYRKQMVELWRRADISLEYRSKFWTLVNGNGFFDLGLHEDELSRLWDLLVLGDDPELLKTGFNVQNRVGISPAKYQRFLRVQNQLDRENIVANLNPTQSSLFSSAMFVSLPKKRKELKVDSMTMDSFATVGTPKYKNEKSLNRLKVIKLERWMVYERLTKCNVNEKKKLYELFNISISQKMKKHRLAGMLWGSYDLADESASFFLQIKNGSSGIQNGRAPSRKGMKRYGISSLQNNTGILDTPTASPSESAWVQELLEKRIKYNLTQTIHAFINGVQNLLVKINQEENSDFTFHRQCDAIGQVTSEKNWNEIRLEYLSKFFNSFEEEE